MFAYVKNLIPGTDKEFYIVHVSRIFHYVGDDQRVPFDPQKFEVTVSYGVVVGKNLVRHQVLLLADTEEELTKTLTRRTESRLRSLPCPKRMSVGPVSVPLKSVKRITEKKTSEGSDSKHEVVKTRQRNILAKMIKRKPAEAQLAKTSHTSSHESELPPKRIKVDSSASGFGDSSEDAVEFETSNPSEPKEKNADDMNDRDGKDVYLSQIKDLKQQLQLTLDEVEAYRIKCSDLESELKTERNRPAVDMGDHLQALQGGNQEVMDKLSVLQNDVNEIKAFIKGAKEKADSKKQKQLPCKLSALQDAAPSKADCDVPKDQVHMGEGKFFISKTNLAKVEKCNGLRPRLKGLLSLMYGEDLPLYYSKKKTSQTHLYEIPEDHIKSFIATLQVFNWKGKEVNLKDDHVQREISKALSELKTEGYPTFGVVGKVQDAPPSDGKTLQDSKSHHVEGGKKKVDVSGGDVIVVSGEEDAMSSGEGLDSHSTEKEDVIDSGVDKQNEDGDKLDGDGVSSVAEEDLNKSFYETD